MDIAGQALVALVLLAVGGYAVYDAVDAIRQEIKNKHAETNRRDEDTPEERNHS